MLVKDAKSFISQEIGYSGIIEFWRIEKDDWASGSYIQLKDDGELWGDIEVRISQGSEDKLISLGEVEAPLDQEMRHQCIKRAISAAVTGETFPELLIALVNYTPTLVFDSTTNIVYVNTSMPYQISRISTETVVVSQLCMADQTQIIKSTYSITSGVGEDVDHPSWLKQIVDTTDLHRNPVTQEFENADQFPVYPGSYFGKRLFLIPHVSCYMLLEGIWIRASVECLEAGIAPPDILEEYKMAISFKKD
ncbi:hypothetical protein D3C78_19610 [compost metagenome]